MPCNVTVRLIPGRLISARVAVENSARQNLNVTLLESTMDIWISCASHSSRANIFSIRDAKRDTPAGSVSSSLVVKGSSPPGTPFSSLSKCVAEWMDSQRPASSWSVNSSWTNVSATEATESARFAPCVRVWRAAALTLNLRCNDFADKRIVVPTPTVTDWTEPASKLNGVLWR